METAVLAKKEQTKNKIPIMNVSPFVLKKIEKQGIEIYKSNEYLSAIYDIMSEGTFSKFMEKNISSHNDVNTAMIYFNLYDMIKTQFRIHFKREIRKGEMLYFMKECMSNKYMREFVMDNANKYTNLERKVTKTIKDKKRIIELMPIPETDEK